jgi:fatty acid desaturase
MSHDIEGVCEHCGLLLPEWVGNRRNLCRCEAERMEKLSQEYQAEVKGELSESGRLIRVIGFMVLAGIGVWCGLVAFWFGMWLPGVCLMGSGVLWCLVGLAWLWMGDSK